MNFNFFHIFIFIITFFTSTSSSQSSQDSQQLISFKNSLPDPTQLRSWQPSIATCSFTGVSCTSSKVTSIDLSNYPLNTDFSKVASFLLPIQNLNTLILKNASISGPIRRFVCSSSLTWIDLAENAISGSVSDISSLGVCSNLERLNLSMNLLDPFVIEPGRGSGLQGLTVLDLSYNKISGESVLSWILSSAFSQLRFLSLKGNKIGGSDIREGVDFRNLEHLDLSINNISSNFPLFQDCSNLQYLDLSSNKFAGDVENSLSSCGNLSFLNLTGNQLTGPVPKLPAGSIRYLYLQSNHFVGGFPADLCKTLLEFDLSFNNFTGSVPDGLASCSDLEVLDITGNNFSGELPVNAILKLINLKNLVFSSNYFIGEVPDSFSKLVNLEILDLSSNNMSGVIPSGICQEPGNKLRVLYLQNNMLTGVVPESLSNCTNLESLDLSFNNLSGTIPTSLSSLSKLKDLIMWLNHLHGEIPEEFMHLRSLQNLILDFNDLSGTIPASLSNCSDLNWVSLSNNQLVGEIPASFGRLSNLAILKLGNNSLSGNIPAQLGDCSSLIWLDLNTNLLNGTIPSDVFKQAGNLNVKMLSGKPYGYIKNDGSPQCHGAGNLLEFGGIREQQLDRISASYPCNFNRVYRGITAPTFNHNGSMIFLDLSFNQLEGEIPIVIGSMFYLQILILGHNELSGPIPNEIGNLKNVAILDMSHNRLSGDFPQALKGLTLLGELDVSNNNLTGRIPDSAPFDTFPDSKFANNSGLCGYPLPACGSGISVGSNVRSRSHRRQASLAGSVVMGLVFSIFCIFGLIIVLVETRKRRKKKEAALEAYMENHSNSATHNSAWKLSAREAMSINLSTFEKPLRNLTFADLLEATNGFHSDSMIGSGGFGDVYKAQLKDGNVVAIKKLIHVSGQGDREFMAEMETIGKIKHRNLVPLLGYCKVAEERLLVYEYMKFGSLEDIIHDRKKIGIKLNWATRRKIAIGSARGLAFLHHNCIPHIIHRDMKSSNVLIDENLEARVSDFGMARHMSAMDTHLSVSTLAGTPGYVPPEYYQSFRCSTKGDVYSYGVVLLELLTGRQPTDSPDFGDNNIVGWVKAHAKTKITDVFDPELIKEDPSLEIELLQHLKVACACLDDRPWKRPTMIQVMAMFKEIQAGSGIDSTSSLSVDDSGFSSVEGIEMSIKEGNELSKHL